jgi:uncharacterized membrane protein YdjX (TVP38/TMEM64 family)
MLSSISDLSFYLQNFLLSIGIWGGLLGILLIIVESILPCLPLCVFITLVFLTFGNLIGFFICWGATVIGCLLSFTICKKLKDWMHRHIKKSKYHKKVDEMMTYIGDMSVASLAMLVAVPFTPAFVVNIAAGLSDMSYKKYTLAIIIGKSFMVYFWGYVGVNLIECFTHPIYLVKIIIMVLLAYVLGKIVNKYVKVD